MSYIELINAFERWLENNYLPTQSQLLFYKFLVIFNRSAWAEWVSVDNLRLMALTQIHNESTLIRHRDNLVREGLIEYQKGKKGFPNKYKINTSILKVKMQVETIVKTGVFPQVKTTVEMTDINRQRERERIKKDISKEISQKRTRQKAFIPPTVEEVKAYCDERDNGIDAAHFVDYYTSNGWKVGKQNMKDWKAAVRTWEKNNFSNNGAKNAKQKQAAQKEYSFDVEKFERSHRWNVPKVGEE